MRLWRSAWARVDSLWKAGRRRACVERREAALCERGCLVTFGWADDEGSSPVSLQRGRRTSSSFSLWRFDSANREGGDEAPPVETDAQYRTHIRPDSISPARPRSVSHLLIVHRAAQEQDEQTGIARVCRYIQKEGGRTEVVNRWGLERQHTRPKAVVLLSR